MTPPSNFPEAQTSSTDATAMPAATAAASASAAPSPFAAARTDRLREVVAMHRSATSAFEQRTLYTEPPAFVLAPNAHMHVAAVDNASATGGQVLAITLRRAFQDFAITAERQPDGAVFRLRFCNHTLVMPVSKQRGTQDFVLDTDDSRYAALVRPSPLSKYWLSTQEPRAATLTLHADGSVDVHRGELYYVAITSVDRGMLIDPVQVLENARSAAPAVSTPSVASAVGSAAPVARISSSASQGKQVAQVTPPTTGTVGTTGQTGTAVAM